MSKVNKEPTVGIIMGSKSDWKDVMEHCSEVLKEFGIKQDVRVISAHRTPKRLEKFISEAEKNNYEIIICAAGGAAHLAGVTAALTTIPVLGVPMPSVTDGIDSLLSTVQMPAGVPVATLAIGKAGAQPGDVIKKINGETVRTLDGLITILRTKRAGQQVEIEILRESQKITLVFELDLRPSDV